MTEPPPAAPAPDSPAGPGPAPLEDHPATESPTDDAPALAPQVEPSHVDEPGPESGDFEHAEEDLDEDDEPVHGPLVYPDDLDEHDDPRARRLVAPPPPPNGDVAPRTGPRPLPPFPGAGSGNGGKGARRKRSRGDADAPDVRPTRTRRRVGLVVAIIGLLLVLLVGWLLVSLYQPFKGDGEGSVAVTIPEGADVASIATLLERRGVVEDATFFRARATVSGRGGDFKAGEFELRRDMSYAAAMDALVDSPDADTVTVTIPEGRARTEVKEIVAGTLEGDYVAASRRSPQLDPSRYRAGSARNLEGFLFPATYELDRGATTRDLVREQLKAFKSQFEKVDLSFARRKNLTPYDVLVIASMIDREAQLARERPLISSVIYNRLSDGIPLGIDATIRFATNNWTQPLTESELSIDSPYNTRTRQGLPPGPIGSPGLEAIRAAARPRRSEFLFYVVKPGTCGEHAFSTSDAQFQRDVERYNSARAERGGKSPTNC